MNLPRLILSICVLLLCSLAWAEEKPVFEPLPLGSVHAQGWIRQQLERSKSGMGGHLDELEPDMIALPYVSRDHKSKVSPGWSGEISGEYWVGLIQLAFTLNDPELIAKADRWVQATIALQEEDGYLGSYRPTENRQEDYCAWSAAWLSRALLSYAEATGNKTVLEAAHRGLLWFVAHWDGEKKTTYAGPVIMESMIDCWRLTGDERLARFAREYADWLDEHDEFHHARKSMLRPVLEYNEDHIVAFGEHVKIPAMLWLYTGDPRDKEASLNGVRQMFAKCWLANGAPCGNDEHMSPPSSIHETEYCNFPTWSNSFLRLLAITGKAEFADHCERLVFNAAQGARKKDERAIAYVTSMNQFYSTDKSSLYQGSFGVYAPNFHVACCPAQSVRLMPEYVRSMFLRDARGNLAVGIYGPADAEFQDENGSKVTIQEVTDYPFGETIRFVIHTELGKTWGGSLRVRIPKWCGKWSSNRQAAGESENWVVFEGAWNDGDELTLTFPMEPRVIVTPDVFFPNEPLHGIECGPLLFSYRIQADWQPIPGNPLTPLPEGWTWFNSKPVKPLFYGFPRDLIDGKLKIVKNQKPLGDAYPWDDPPLTLTVPLLPTMKHVWPWRYGMSDHTTLPYGNPVRADEGQPLQNVELVPYGATNLRMTCFPTALSE